MERVSEQGLASCALCGEASTVGELAEGRWLAPEARRRLARGDPGWRRDDGACPACVQHLLLEMLLEKGEAALHDAVQKVWPLDAEAAFGALPTPLRVHAHPRYSGAGVTVALVDAAFSPHPDLVRPRNRIKAWVDASREPVNLVRYGPDEVPEWPGSGAADPGQWHGLMTSAVAAGNGALSHGLYRGLAPEAELVLIQVRGASGRIGNASIARALDWLRWEAADLSVRVVSLSLGGDPVAPLAGNPVDDAVAALVRRGLTVVVASGNDGERRLVPPGTAPDALTIGGIDDKNTLDHAAREMWRSNYGEAAGGALKPELVAPSLWVVAPILPATALAEEARSLFERRASGDSTSEARLSALKMVSPHYQHVEGTSFAAPLVAGVVACMVEANSALTPRRIRELLVATAQPVTGAAVERQGAGALDAGRAVTLAAADRHSKRADFAASPQVTSDSVEFLLHDHRARTVSVSGSWDGWQRPGAAAQELEAGLWRASMARPGRGEHHYKFLLDGRVWLADPGNPLRAHDGYGAWNSVLVSSR
jgi:serine protease AprX